MNIDISTLLNPIYQISDLNLSPEVLTGISLLGVFLAIKILSKALRYAVYISLMTFGIKTAITLIYKIS